MKFKGTIIDERKGGVPLLNIYMITYNHEKFIAEAIESVLMQKTNFDFQIIIGEDCSTDNTRKICIDYQKKHPEKIKLLLQKKNLGAIPNSFFVYDACVAKYVAILEGDDYWTDPLKLQKQVDFLENNSQSAACFHKVNYNTMDIDKRYIFPEKLTKNEFSLNDVLAFVSTGWVVMTSTIIYRNKALGKLPQWFLKLHIGDWPIIFLSSLNGTINYIDETMGVYRENNNSLTQTEKYSNINSVSYLIQFYKLFNLHTNSQYKYSIYKQLTFLEYQLIIYYTKRQNYFLLLKELLQHNHYKIVLSYRPETLKTGLLFLLNYPRLIFRSPLSIDN